MISRGELQRLAAQAGVRVELQERDYPTIAHPLAIHLSHDADLLLKAVTKNASRLDESANVLYTTVAQKKGLPNYPFGNPQCHFLKPRKWQWILNISAASWANARRRLAFKEVNTVTSSVS